MLIVCASAGEKGKVQQKHQGSQQSLIPERALLTYQLLNC